MCIGIVLLHTVEEHHRLLRLPEAGINVANRLQIIDVVFERPPYLKGNLLYLSQCLLVAPRTVQRR